MRVGVEHAVLEHHLDVRVHHRLDHASEVDLAGGDPFLQPVDPGALDVLEDQHPPGDQLGDDFGHHHARLVLEVAAEGGRVARLLAEVELVADPLGELTHGALCFLYGRLVEPYWPETTHTRVESGKLAVGSAPIRLVHLSERRGGDGVAMESLEESVGVLAELLLDAGFDLREGARRHLVGEGTDG